jgi:D-alanyl-D-alanine carboxypeptidase
VSAFRAPLQLLLLLLSLGAAWLLPAPGARAAPKAAFVMDARTGQVLLAENADTRLHPASLTKMMTLYVAFEAVERGEIALDREVTVSGQAAAEPGARLGLRAGQRISLRHLVRAVAVKSANDAATALAEAISGDEAAFVARMNRTSAAMGLDGTRFRNAHGLTTAGHLSTARDMSRLGRRLRLDFPGYWALFSRLSTDAGLRRVAHTNRRFLSAYDGADGIKTGYTRAAGYNLTASAVRGEHWVIATLFGASSSPVRAAQVARLMDAAFARLPAEVAAVPPPPMRAPSGLRGAGPTGAMAPVRPLLVAPEGKGSGRGDSATRSAGAVALSSLSSASGPIWTPSADRPRAPGSH